MNCKGCATQMAKSTNDLLEAEARRGWHMQCLLSYTEKQRLRINELCDEVQTKNIRITNLEVRLLDAQDQLTTANRARQYPTEARRAIAPNAPRGEMPPELRATVTAPKPAPVVAKEPEPKRERFELIELE